MSRINMAALDALEKIQASGAPDLVVEIIDMFMLQKALVLKAVESAIMAGEHLNMASEAHKFKSTCRTLGAVKLGRLVEQFEDHARNNDLTLARDAWEKLKPELEAVICDLQKIKLDRIRHGQRVAG